MKRICVVTSTRAEYGLLRPLINRIQNDSDMELDLIVTGGHLSKEQGFTQEEIVKDGYDIDYCIPILKEDNSATGVSYTMAEAIRGFADCFSNDRPDIVVLLGDRTEMLGVAVAAMNENIPIAHISGGEVTEGAVDDCIRHALSKMSYIHFPSTDIYRKRIIQLGEEPERVYNVGALGAENVLTQELYNRDELPKNIVGLPSSGMYAVATYHPVTLDCGKSDVADQINTFCHVMKNRKDIFFIITASNTDVGGATANKLLAEFAENTRNAMFVHNLGLKRYLSAVKYASFVIGNSSSGIIEAPILGTPTVNIGDRQKGRLMPESIINCNVNSSEINDAIDRALVMERKPTNIYGDGHTSEKILKIIKEYLLNEKINLKKGFYDIKIDGL